MSILSAEGKRIIKKLVDYNGSVFHHKSMSDGYLRTIKNNAPPKKYKKSQFYLGSKLIIRHPITAQHIWAETDYRVDYSNLNQYVAKLNRQINNYFVSQSYEALESYLYSVAAKICLKNRKAAVEIKNIIKCADTASFRKHLKDKWRSTNELYTRVIIKLLPEMDTFIRENPSFKNYGFFLEVLLKARHSITHNEGIIAIDDVKDKKAKEYLIDFFGKYNSKPTMQIDCTEHAHEIIGTIAKIVHLIEHFL